MGANYDVLLIEGATRDAIVGRLSEYLKPRRRFVQSIRPYAEDDGRSSENTSVFIGTQSNRGWTPLVVSPAVVDIAVEDWHVENDFHRALSLAGRRMGSLWSYDSGYVAGYAVYERGELRDARYAIHDPRPELRRDRRAAQMQGELFSTVFSLPGESYESFMESCGDLEKGTAQLVERLFPTAHLFDVIDLSDGDGATALVNGEYQCASMAGWDVIQIADLQP
jgi:hypothetical protein